MFVLVVGGGKVGYYLAKELIESGHEVALMEKDPRRADGLERTAKRLHADGVVSVHVADAGEPVEGRFDRVLVDPPCTGLGTLQSRPDLRWHATEEAPLTLQTAILDAAAAVAERRVVYSTCTISRAENEDQVAAFMDRHPEFSLSGTIVTLPHRDGTDGFYIATLDRA